MLTDKQLTELTLLMMEEDFEKSPAAQELEYQELVEACDRVCAKLCGKLDDRRVEILQELLMLRDQMEYTHSLHYLQRGIARGADLAGRAEIPGELLTFS